MKKITLLTLATLIGIGNVQAAEETSIHIQCPKLTPEMFNQDKNFFYEVHGAGNEKTLHMRVESAVISDAVPVGTLGTTYVKGSLTQEPGQSVKLKAINSNGIEAISKYYGEDVRCKYAVSFEGLKDEMTGEPLSFILSLKYQDEAGFSIKQCKIIGEEKVECASSKKSK